MGMRLAACLLIVLAACTGASSTTEAGSGLPPLDSLTVEWGCGHGFWASNSDQTAALHISYLGQGEPDRSVTLPHDEWEAVVLVGRDLHANWCDDVLEPDEPTPVEVAGFPVIGGELHLVGETPAPFTGGELTVEAKSLQVETADGETTQWGSITITNPMWGMFAG